MKTQCQQHMARLNRIAAITGTYSRRFTFDESRSFLRAYKDETIIGYPRELAVQRAWDYWAAGRHMFGVTR